MNVDVPTDMEVAVISHRVDAKRLSRGFADTQDMTRLVAALRDARDLVQRLVRAHEEGHDHAAKPTAHGRVHPFDERCQLCLVTAAAEEQLREWSGRTTERTS